MDDADQMDNRVRQFLKDAGRGRMMARLGVSERMIRHAARKNEMPATWYKQAVQVAEEAHIDPPALDLFTFK